VLEFVGTSMERDIRLATATREELLLVIGQPRATIAAQQQTIARLEALVAQQQQTIAAQQATIAELEQRVADLERRLGPGAGPPQSFPGHKPQQAPPAPPTPKPPRKRRPHGFVRKRSAHPDAVVMHAVEQCPDCHTPLAGGWVKRRRQILEVVLAPAKVVEHQYWERECCHCRQRFTPRVALPGQVLGKARLGVNLLALIATLREQGRWRFETIQWYLETFHGLDLSVGALVGAVQQVAHQGQTAVERIQAQVRGASVVHADETGWRENGRNQDIWSFSTPTACFFQYGRRTKEMVDAALGPSFAGVLVTDFYAAYNHYHGEHQRCWVHLLRDIHDLKRQHPTDASVGRWASTIHRLYRTAKRVTSPDSAERLRLRLRLRLERALLAVVEPFAKDQRAPQRVLSQRMVQFLKELFVFVADPQVPADNNAAERSVRHLVTARKISGGTRSAGGTAVKMALSTLFGTWRLRGLNSFLACRQLLSSPQP
jgi:transposase